MTDPEKAEKFRTDQAGIESVLRTSAQAQFEVIEMEVGFSLEVLVRSASSGGCTCFVINKARRSRPEDRPRTWKTSDSVLRFIRQICPKHLRISPVKVHLTLG